MKVIDRLVLNKENYRGVATSRQLDLRQLAKGADTISFAGTDRGVVQMAVSVPVSMERVLNHVNVFNDDIGDTTLDTIKLPETFTVTAKGLDNDCGTTAHMKMMQKLKKVCY